MGGKRLAWAITGAGHKIRECTELLLRIQGVDVFLSRAAEEVLAMYELLASLSGPGIRIYRTTDASSSVVGRFFSGQYSALVVAPATSNSVAKFVHGISDSLVTNLFSQAGKARVPVIVFPTDLSPEMESFGPRGRPVKVFPRDLDLENTAKLRTVAGVTVVSDTNELQQCLAGYLNR